MQPLYDIACARPQDLHLLPAIELAAAALLTGHAPESILSEATSEKDFREAQAEGRLWVVLTREIPIGFAHVEVLGAPSRHEVPTAVNKETSRDRTSVHIRQVCAGDFDEILKINAECSPHVAKLEAEDLRELVALTSIAPVATDYARVVGYVLAFLSSDVNQGEEFQSFLVR
jgi:hypothetical protein